MAIRRALIGNMERVKSEGYGRGLHTHYFSGLGLLGALSGARFTLASNSNWGMVIAHLLHGFGKVAAGRCVADTFHFSASCTCT